MSRLDRALALLACAHCAAPLELRAKEGLCCSACPKRYRELGALIDLRIEPERAPDPLPLAAGELDAALAALESGQGFKAVLERLLLDLPQERADRLDLALREVRGAWLPLLAGPAAGSIAGGRALHAGNAFSGTVVGLAKLGYEVVSIDRSPARSAFAQHRNEWLVPGRVLPVVGGDDRRLPFASASFDLVVQEEGLPGPGTEWSWPLSECRRICRGELALVADNRLGYKRSTGAKSEFRVPGPLEYLRGVLRPGAPLATLFGYRRALRGEGFDPPRAYALYPHRRDFAFVIALDGPGPELPIGEKERANRLKLWAHRAGLFPVLTPSFLLIGARSARAEGRPGARGARPRLERALDELAEVLGEPRPAVEQLVGTRGNTSLAQTAVPGRDPEDPAGRWTLHLSVSPLQEVQARTHYARLVELARERPGFPVPQPLFQGELAGIFAVVARRLGGLTAPQHTGDRAIARRMYAETSEHLARLVAAPARAMDEALFEELVGAKVDLVARYAAVPSTLEWLARARREARERMIGLSFPRVVYHSDLRSKHVQVAPDGRVLGYLDWGSSEASDLPYQDLLHLIVHERKQEAGLATGAAWRLALEPGGLRDFEREALEDLARRLALPAEYCRAIERLYPVLVSAMAEKNWEYSRPRWMHRSFAI